MQMSSKQTFEEKCKVIEILYLFLYIKIQKCLKYVFLIFPKHYFKVVEYSLIMFVHCFFILIFNINFYGHKSCTLNYVCKGK